MPKNPRTLDPQRYLDYLIECWNPIVAAERLGCDVSDIRALQKSRKFVERYLAETVQATGPRVYLEEQNRSVMELIADQKMESYWALKEMGADETVPANVRVRVHKGFFDMAAAIEGVTQKVQHDHVVTHKLDADSVLALESARAESSRLLVNPTIDVTGEDMSDG